MNEDEKPKRKFLNVKIGDEFYDALMTKPCFLNNWKAISPCFYFVKHIAELNAMKNGERAEFDSGIITKIFQPYTGGRYEEFLDALDSDILGIIQIDRHYAATLNKKGRCMNYVVTDYGCRLIHSSNMEYLRRLHNDPALRRSNQKNISNRKVMTKTYDDPVLNHIHEGLINTTFDMARVEQMLEKSCWSDNQKASVSSKLCRFATKKFTPLEYKSVDGRVHHDEVGLKSDARGCLLYKGMPYKATLDIRSCHPTFFSLYVLSLYTLHYVPHKTDITTLLEQEHQKWLKIFCHPTIDPKTIIRKACRFRDEEQAKAAINQSLNGSMKYPKFLQWLKTEFPTLFQIWQTTNVKHTGNAIARQYEHALILRGNLFDLGISLGVKLQSEHDGFGVFAADDGDKLDDKLEQMAKDIQEFSARQFGVPVVVKVKRVFDWTSTDVRAEMEHKLKELEKEYNKLDLNRIRRRSFAGAIPKSVYWETEKKEFALLRRHKDVLAYWVAQENRDAEQRKEMKKVQSAMFKEEW